MGAIYRGILDRIEAADYDVFSQVIRVPRPRRALIAATTWARSTAGSGDARPASRSTVVGDRRRRSPGWRRRRRWPRRAARAGARGPRRARRPRDARSPIARPASCVTTASTSCSAAITRRSSLLRRIGAEANVRTAAVPGSAVPRSRRTGDRCCAVRGLPSPLHLLGGVFGWDALGWPDRLRVLRVAGPLLPRAAIPPEGGSHKRPCRLRLLVGFRVQAEETVAQWLTRYGQRGRLREWLWEPLAVAALNQAPATRRRTTFVRVLAEMFGPGAPRLVAGAAGDRRCTRCTRSRRSRYIEARGGEVRVNALARVSSVPALAGPPPGRRPRRAAARRRRRSSPPSRGSRSSRCWSAIVAPRADADRERRRRWRRSRSSRSTSGTTAP